MDLDEINRILDLMREHELAEFELEREGVTLRLKKHTVAPWAGAMPQMPQMSFAPPMTGAPPAAPATGQGDAPVLTPADEDVDLAIVKSPIVGTFYRSAEPGAKPFVEVGSRVKKGQVLCIIEAMKLMNEIESDIEGTITKIYPQNGQPVEYGEKLFAVKI